MTTSLTLRSEKGSALTHAEGDANLTALRTTADAALAASDTLTADKAEAAALGVANTDQNMGSFTGSTIADNVSAKAGMQALETSHEAAVTASGIALGATNYGTFTGTTIADSSTSKTALQALETAVETKANASAVGVTSSAANMGTYTGSTISDNQTAKQNLQEIETAVEARPTSAALSASSGSSLVGFIQSGTGAVARTAQAKMREYYSSMDTGAAGDGVSDDKDELSQADTNAVALGKPLFITGAHKVSSNVTLNADLIFDGGSLIPDTGVTITIRGVVSGPISQIFSGNGSVIGIRQVKPEWFGAVRDGVTDDITALNKANTCVMSSKTSRGGRQKIMLAGGTYGVSSSWIVTPTADVNLIVEGAGTILGGTRLTDIAAFSSTTTPVFQVDGNSDSTQQIADWGISGFGVVAGAGSATIGIQLGSTDSTKKLIGQSWQNVEDIFVDQFANNWKIIHVRMIKFSRVSGWNNGYVGACTPLLITTNGWFTGDLVFDDTCQFVSNSATTSGTKCVNIVCSSGNYNSGTGANQIAGIKFGNCDLYTGQRAVEIYCSNGGYISDIWFTETQFDQQSTTAIYIEANKDTATTPVIQNINVLSSYFASNLGATISLVSTSGGIMRNVSINSNYTNSGQSNFVKVSGTANAVKDIHVNDNRIINNNFNGGAAGYVIDLLDAIGIQCKGNVCSRDGSNFFDYVVRIASGANHYVVRDNSAGGIPSTGLVLDNGGAVTKSVGDNI